MGNIRIATQLYPMRNEAAKDLFSVLDTVSGMGYDGVEFVGLYNRSADDIRKHADGLGLKIVSGHVSLGMLANDIERTINTHKALGCEFIVLGWLEEAERHYGPNFASTVLQADKAAKACRDAGLPLAYHNHNFEFTKGMGKNGLDQLMDGAEALQVQFDTGWLGIAGQDPVALLEKYAGRYSSVHLKDYLKTDGAASHDFCPIGLGGILDYAAISKAAVQGGAKWLIVDQDDDARRPMPEALKLSLSYLRSLGY